MTRANPHTQRLAAALNEAAGALLILLGRPTTLYSVGRHLGENPANYAKIINGTRPVSADRVMEWLATWNARGDVPPLRMEYEPPAPPTIRPVGFADRGVFRVVVTPTDHGSPWWEAAARDPGTPKIPAKAWADLLAFAPVMLTGLEADLLRVFAMRVARGMKFPLRFEPAP